MDRQELLCTAVQSSVVVAGRQAYKFGLRGLVEYHFI
jgi:hypothetical protein